MSNKKHVRRVLVILLVLELMIILFGALIIMSIPGEHLSSHKYQNNTTRVLISTADSQGNVTNITEEVQTNERIDSGPALYSDCVFFVITTITTVGYGKFD